MSAPARVVGPSTDREPCYAAPWQPMAWQYDVPRIAPHCGMERHSARYARPVRRRLWPDGRVTDAYGRDRTCDYR